MSADNWTIKDIRVVNAAQPSGERPKHAPTTYHSPRLKRTIMDGPGNRSSIIDCTCGARFDGDYAYVGLDRRVCDWYAQHAGIMGGGEAVAAILRQYDTALDLVDYPDYPRTMAKRLPGTSRRETQHRADLNSVDSEVILDTLRTGSLS